ncbi:MAG: acyl-CoA thioesterase [Bacteroidota bacterium]
MLAPIDPSHNYPKETHSRVIIRFQDCDPLGHLNNSRYFDYMFNARADQLAKGFGFSLSEVFKTFGSAWVIYDQHIAYLRSALPGEWVRINSRLLFHNEDTLLVEYYMTDDSQQELKAVLWTTLKYVDLNSGKKIPHQPLVNDYLGAMQFPEGLEEDEILDPSWLQRVRGLRKKLSTPHSDKPD